MSGHTPTECGRCGDKAGVEARVGSPTFGRRGLTRLRSERRAGSRRLAARRRSVVASDSESASVGAAAAWSVPASRYRQCSASGLDPTNPFQSSGPTRRDDALPTAALPAAPGGFGQARPQLWSVQPLLLRTGLPQLPPLPQLHRPPLLPAATTPQPAHPRRQLSARQLAGTARSKPAPCAPERWCDMRPTPIVRQACTFVGELPDSSIELTAEDQEGWTCSGQACRQCGGGGRALTRAAD